MKINNVIIVIFTSIALLSSCNVDNSNKAIKKLLNSSQNNKKELLNILSTYDEKDQKHTATKFLLSNMLTPFSYDTTHIGKYRELILEIDSIRNTADSLSAVGIINTKWSKLYGNDTFADIYSNSTFDRTSITSEYLINDINQAFDTWQNSIFKDSINYDTFQKFILPYRIKSGYIIEDWRTNLNNRFSDHYNKYDDPIEMVDSVMNLVKDYTVDWWTISNYPFICLSDYETVKLSKCAERCWFNAMILRSLGLPCTIDFVPAWGNRNHGHEWNAILFDGKTYPFESTGGTNGKWKAKQVYNNEWVDEFWMKSRLPKVFRHTYEINYNGPEIKDAPHIFRNRNYVDVSSEYFKTTDVSIANKYANSSKNTYAYLCVFNEDRWKPVYWGKRSITEKYVFKDMGRNIAYLPAFYQNGLIVPINDAFIIDSLGNTQVLSPQTTKTENVNVTRKYLERPDLDIWKKQNINSSFEISDNNKFDNKRNIFTVNNLNLYPTMWRLDEPHNTRYLRYTFSENYESLAELYFYSKDKEGNLSRIEDPKIMPSSKMNINEINKLFDDNILSYASFPIPEDSTSTLYIDFDFGRIIELDALGICPRNDKNNIIKGLDYELFYWNQKWVSLGVKTATDYSLTFDSVPSNALLLLKCTTEGNENRIFTWENNTQVWW